MPTNYERAFEQRPEVYATWVQLNSEIKAGMDVVFAAAARCFFSKTLDALGVLPDSRYRALEPGLREALVVGRPIADG